MKNQKVPAISVSNLSKNFKLLQVFSEISFDVFGGEFMSIIGPSGCGKSTLLKIIGGIIKPSSGELKLKEKNTIDKGDFGFVFQNPVLLPWRTLKDNINLPLELFDKSDFHDISNLIELLGLKGFEESLPNQLSGGMQQRVALARALVFKPSVLLLDEPFASLDELNRDKLKHEVIEVCHKLQTTALMVTHSISDAVLMSDKVIVLSKRPAKILKIIEITLPKPRTHEIEISNEFIKLVEEIRECLGKQ